MKKKIVSVLIISATLMLLCISMIVPAVADEVTTPDGFTYVPGSVEGTIEITGYTGAGGNITIPDSIDNSEVTSIGQSAFENNTDITGVIFGKNIKVIGQWAFKNCSNLSSITLNDGLITIGHGSLEGLNITKVVIPDTVELIDLWSFASNTELSDVTIGKNVREIKYNAFQDCIKLTEIVIPSSVKTMGVEVFKGCSSLEKITVQGHPTVTVGTEEDTFGGKTPTYHPICGAACDHGTSGAPDPSHAVTEWTAWTEASAMPSTGGAYVLMNDVTLPDTWKNYTGDMTVCLNGHTIKTTQGRVIEVVSGQTLTLCDCQATTGSITGGKITGGGAGIHVAGTLVLYGGKITGNSCDGAYNGGGVHIDTNGAFYMHGGEILENNALNGGAVNVGGGIFNMTGGAIENNTADNNGGGVFISASSSVTVSGNIVIGDNTVSNNKNNIYLQEGAQINVNTLSESARIGISFEDGLSTAFGIGGKSYIDRFSVDTSELYHLTFADDDIIAEEHTGVLQSTDETYHYYECSKCFFDFSGKHIISFAIDEKFAVAEKDNTYYVTCKVCETVHPEEKTFSTVSHPICGASCLHDGTHTDVQFVIWTDTEAMPTDAGYYSLGADVIIPDTWKNIEGNDIYLCLNGHTLKTIKGRVIELTANQNITICDCQAEQGAITGGSIDDNGGGIYTEGILNLYGGRIVGNKSTRSSKVGSKGGGVYIAENGIFNMYGGSISGNKATSQGGGVYIAENAVFNMYGGEIINNKTNLSGGGVHIIGSFFMGGGSISGNVSIDDGAGIGNNGAFRMSGGSISNNTSYSSGGGIFVFSNKTVELGGDAVIYGNTGDAHNHDLHMQENAVLTLGALTTGARIGISTDSTYSGALIANGAENISNFISTNKDYHLKADGDDIIIEDHSFTEDVCTVCSQVLQSGCKHPVCGAECAHGEEHGEIVFSAWTATDSMPTESGNYYLTGNVSISESWHPANNTVLCLNGYDVKFTGTSGSVIYVDIDVTFTLCDCHRIGGAVTGGKTDSNGGGVYIDGLLGNTFEGGIFYMYGGRITENKASNDGAGVYIGGGATFYLYGGEISYNSRPVDGGGVYSNYGNFFMYGGSISNNSSYYGGGYGGMTLYSCIIAGGEISNNSALFDGGGICHLSGAMDITGGKIYDNSASDEGGGIYNSARIEMTGGEIYNNRSSAAGGGVFNSGKFTMSGGSIYWNRSVNSTGGGIFGCSEEAINLSGKIMISDNDGNGKTNNVHLQSNAIISAGELEDGAKIGISVDDGYEGSFISGENINIQSFISDNSGFMIVKRGNDHVIVAAHDHVWSTACVNDMSDSEMHYHACTVSGCIAVDGGERHTPDEDDGNCKTAILCTACQYEVTAGKESHSFGSYRASDTDSSLHYRECTSEGCAITVEEAHTKAADDGNCTTPVLCSKCDFILQAANANHTYSSSYNPENADEQAHYHICTVEGCRVRGNAEAHGFGEDNICDACGYEINNESESESESGSESEEESDTELDSESDTEETSESDSESEAESADEYDSESEIEAGSEEESVIESESETETNSNSGAAGSKESGLPVGAIAAIAVFGVILLGAGGFSVVWFVIKKKSFAELIAIFKKR